MRDRVPAVVLGLIAMLAGASATAQVRLGGNDIYGVAVAETGEYTAKTGPLHPVVVGANLFFDGAFDNPWSSFSSVRSYDSNREWELKTGVGAASSGFTCSVMDSAATKVVEDIVTGGRVTGTRITWTLADAGDDLTITQEINAEGVVFEDSVVRVTLCVRNDDRRDDAHVGIRFQWDWQIGNNDGAFFGIRPPSPPIEPYFGVEQDFPLPVFDSYDISDNATPSVTPSLYSVGGTVLNPQLPIPPTPPELVQYASWPGGFFGLGAYDTCFTYDTVGDLVGNADSAVTYYWGATPGTSLVVPPGESWCATQYVFVFQDVPPPLCQIAPVVTGGAACDAPSVPISAAGSASADCDGTLEYAFVDPTGVVAQDWSYDFDMDATQAGTWIVQLRCDTDPSCLTQRDAPVALSLSPLFTKGEAHDAASCNLGIELTWNEATFRDSGRGAYNIYRSESDCSDPSPVLVEAGWMGLRWVDNFTVEGVTYTYFVEAEDSQSGTQCSPPGPFYGGSRTRLCVGAVTEVANPASPAGVCYTLRMGHVGHEVTADWSTARALLAGEHFHLLKASSDPRAPFAAVNPEGDLSTLHVETDASATRQFFDLRVANACEVLSADDEPPSLTGLPQPCP